MNIDKTNWVVMPTHINVYNGSNERCDMLVGACSCGAWHHIEDWEGKIENVASFISSNPVLNEVCRFADIEQGKFFIYEGVKLCRFGCYGMGIDANGTCAKKLSDDTEVVKANFI